MNHKDTNEKFVLIIFGASGDLARLKLFPSIYDLHETDKLNSDFAIYGYARSAKTNEEFRKFFEQSVRDKRKNINEDKLKDLLEKVFYTHGQYNEIEGYNRLFESIKSKNFESNIRKIAYFSVPPQVFRDIIENLGKFKQKKENIQLILEKPFGEDGASAKELFVEVSQCFDEDKDVYLLDHYLGKQGVQSILPLRYDNSILNTMLQGSVIKNIQITVKENFGIQERAGYYDQVGIIKDMIQSHLLQILALIAMDIPVVDSPRNIHREKYNILSALRYPGSSDNIILGQYASYCHEKDVPLNSLTPTFAAIKLYIDRIGWYKVPIYLRTGKKLDKKIAYIVIEFKKLPFQKDPSIPTNKLILELQPEEKIHIRLVKKYSSNNKVTYDDIITSDNLSSETDMTLEEHGRLILEMLNHDKTNFLSFNEILECWRLTDFLYKIIDRYDIPLILHHDNSIGPDQQNNLTATDHNMWHEI